MNNLRVKLPAVRRAVQDTLWAIQPEKLEQMLAVLEVHAGAGTMSAEQVRAQVGARDRTQTVRSTGAIAVIPLHGIIAQRMNMMMQFSGGTSTELFGRDFDALVNDPDIAHIIIDVDSPGGSVAGTPELAKKILSARGKKPITAVCNSLMCSAAYWIGSAADEIVATPSSEGIGSIGVFAVHEDYSKMAETMGIKFTIVRAPEHKAEGNPWEPLSPEAEAFWQAQIDEIYGMFVGAIAKHRDVSPKAVRDNYGDGRALTAKQALAAGMINRIATLDEVIEKLGGGSGAASRARAGAATMSGGKPVSGLELPTVAASSAAEEDEGDGKCPTCGAELEEVDDQTNACRTCDPSAFPDEEEVEEEDDGASAREAAAASVGHASHQPAPKGQETPVQTTTAAPPGAGTDSAAVLAAERTRVAGINELCAQENMPTLAAELIASGATQDQAAARILTEIRTQRAAAPGIQVGGDRAADRPFTSFGEQMVAVVQAGRPGGRRDPRLNRANQQMQAAVSGMNEGVGSEGGFFVQPDLLPGVIDPVYTDDPILSRVTRIPTSKAQVKYNVVDETARTNGNRWGGISMRWAAEGDQGAGAKPKMREMVLDLKKLIGLAYLTDELTEDAPAAEALLTRAFQAELKFMLAAAIFAGTGAGQPLGILKSGAVISQAIEGGQTIANSAASLALNTSKMMSRIPASLWGGIIWLYNQELLPYLQVATLGGTTVGAFTAAGGATNRPNDSVWGRPAFASEMCEAVGTPGDLLCVVPSEYHMIDRGGPKQSQSVHLRFDYDELTLKITYRVDGAPVWRDGVTPYKGANKRSPFVTLAVRV